MRTRPCHRWLKAAAYLFAHVFALASGFAQPTINWPPGGGFVWPNDWTLIRSTGPVLLRASLVDRDGVVTSVYFYEGTNLLGNATSLSSNEFVLPWTPARIGNFSFYATAVDDKGATGITATVWISVATNVPSFSVMELETSPTSTPFTPWAINNHGVVVGSVSNSAARWANWRFETIDVFGKPATARAISDDGAIVGEFVQAQGQPFIVYLPFYYSPGHAVTQLRGVTSGKANAISRAGIVGTASTNYPGPGTVYSGFRYDGSTYTFLNREDLRTEARDINEEGVIVGSLSRLGGDRQAFISRGDEITLVPTQGDSTANAINRRGQVVGTAGIQAFFNDNGKVTNIGIPGGPCVAVDLNDDCAAVGYFYRDSVNEFTAVLFHEGTLIDLNHLIPTNSGWSLRQARSINNAGWIVGLGSRLGDGYFPTVGSRGFLLVPGPMMRVTRSTPAALEGRAYLAPGPAVFEKSTDLVHWQPVATNTTGSAEISFSLALAPTDTTTFYRVVQPPTP